jgi:hypothetical protein
MYKQVNKMSFKRTIIEKEILELEDATEPSTDNSVEVVPKTNVILVRSGFMARKLKQWIDKPIDDVVNKLYVSALEILAAGFDDVVVQAMGISNVYTAMHAVDKLLGKAGFLKEVEVRRVRRPTIFTVEQKKRDSEELETVQFTSYLYGVRITLLPTISPSEMKKLIKIISAGATVGDAQPGS